MLGRKPLNRENLCLRRSTGFAAKEDYSLDSKGVAMCRVHFKGHMSKSQYHGKVCLRNPIP